MPKQGKNGGNINRRTYLGGLAATAAGMAGAAGCLGFGGDDGADDSTVTFWGAYLDLEDIQGTIDWYRQEAEDQYGITVETNTYSFDDLQSNYISSANTGSPDLFMGTIEQYAEYVKSDLAEPIGDRIEDLEYYDQYKDGVLDAVSYQGEIYGLPFIGSGRVLFYREDIFEKHDLEPPEDAEEFIETARYITENEDGMYGYSNTTERGSARSFQEWMSKMYKMADNVFAIDGDEWVLVPDTDDFGEVFQWYYADAYLGDEPLPANPNVRGQSGDDSDAGYLRGESAMIEGGQWIPGSAGLAEDEERGQEILDNTVAMAIPAPPGAPNPLRTYRVDHPNMMNPNSENKEQAWEALSLYSSKETVQRLEDEAGFIGPPVFEGVETQMGPNFADALETSVAEGQTPAFVDWGSAQEALADELQNVIYGEKGPYEAGEDLHASFQELVSDFEV